MCSIVVAACIMKTYLHDLHERENFKTFITSYIDINNRLGTECRSHQRNSNPTIAYESAY